MQSTQPLAEMPPAPATEMTAPANMLTATVDPGSGAEGGGLGEVLLTGFRLPLARVGWLAIACISLGLYIAILPVSYDQILNMKIFSDPVERAVALKGLADLGMSPRSLADYTVGLNLFRSLAYLVVGVIIFAKKSDRSVAILLSLFLITYPPARLLVGSEAGAF